MSAVVPSALSAAGLLGGYSVARATGNRPLGGAVLAVAGAAAFSGWQRNRGTGRAAALTALYVGAFGYSHPLAKKIGAWPSVYTVTGAVAAASLLFGGPRKAGKHKPKPAGKLRKHGRGLNSFEQTAESFRHAAAQARKDAKKAAKKVR